MKQTQWQQFKENFLWIFIGINIVGLIALVDTGSPIALTFNAISLLLPIANYISWKIW